MDFAPRDRLRRVSEATARDMVLWLERVSLEQDTGRSLEELRQRSTADRLALAVACTRRARVMMNTVPPLNRDAVSRSYYAMYHAWRAVAFFSHGGDDFQEHKKLPDFAPPGFQDAVLWQNRLKEAREARNRSDYRAYPKAEGAWRREAEKQYSHAVELVRLSRAYLRGRGCQYV